MPAPITPATPMTPSMQMPTPMPAPMPGPSGSQNLPGVPGPPLETLEQRLYDLLAPFRENDFDADGNDIFPSRNEECKALVLCRRYYNVAAD